MKIGICVREYDKKGEYGCFDKCIGIPKSFVDILQNFNVTPVFLTMGCGLQEMIDLTDGLIVPGSALSMRDLREYPVDKEIIKLYLDKKPIFGICGGMQELCVALGGKVIEGAAKDHMNVVHTVLLNGIFQHMFGCDEIKVNSYHANFCQNPLNGADIAVSNHNDDLILEGFYLGLNLGVQWHPEVMEREHYEKVFQYFFNLCNSHHV